MKKELMSIESIVRAKNALDKLLAQPGIPYKKAYWLDRNRKFLEPSVKKWFGENKEIFKKYIDPIKKVMTPEKMEEYKEEVNKMAESYRVDVEFAEIDLDQNMELILQQIPGDNQVALSFMLKEKSSLEVFPTKGLQS